MMRASINSRKLGDKANPTELTVKRNVANMVYRCVAESVSQLAHNRKQNGNGEQVTHRQPLHKRHIRMERLNQVR
ncbi:hypothetical protein M6D81_01615 [Paenibacillus sp. J5C_2022]|nr:hypothetical protein [Paenibacillus sp. J5C2022]